MFKLRTFLLAGFTVMVISSQCALKKDLILSDSGKIAPVLTPKQSLKAINVESGFEVKLVAAEPLITAPVAITFDKNGRIWAVEMNGYMPDTLGVGEDLPSGKIVVLEDTDNDGRMDVRKVIIDSLKLPRALCIVDDGLLVAEPPNLWYYPIKNDKPLKRLLVDAKYTEGGNVEHYPNGLYRALDNWIYNAKSSKRYRRINNVWKIEKTHFRGQWGISQDDYGRLYYNENSSNVDGDFFSAGIGADSEIQQATAGFNENIVKDTRVYPAHPTPGVNRGYIKGILDAKLKLVKTTAACSPLFYRGGTFGQNYSDNVFIAEPSANLIKRNVLNVLNPVTSGAQAYSGKEFLTSTDERFRPVSLYDGPDGALYIVDMYRGIIQHETYLTPYLKNHIKNRGLSYPLSCGRIYKVVAKNTKSKILPLPTDVASLSKLLGNNNGWVRDKVQQILVDNNSKSAITSLRHNLNTQQSQLLKMHSFWTLEGLGGLEQRDVLAMLNKPEWPLRMQALAVLPKLITPSNFNAYLAMANRLIAGNDTLAAIYLPYMAASIKTFDKKSADALIMNIVNKFANNAYVADAVINTLDGPVDEFQKEFISGSAKSTILNVKLQKIIADNDRPTVSRNTEDVAKQYPKGALIFKSFCQTCHGKAGEGMKSLAPPLNNSQWVTGDKIHLINIVLFGLTGPVEVNGHIYTAPEINGDMPGIGANKTFSDDEIAQVLSFIRKSWRNNADAVNPGEVSFIRQSLPNRQQPFTVAELLQRRPN